MINALPDIKIYEKHDSLPNPYKSYLFLPKSLVDQAFSVIIWRF